MPYTSMDEVNPALKGIKPPITLEQANLIASWADEMSKSENPPKNPWAVAIAQFKKLYEVKDGAWVKKEAKQAVAAVSFDEIRRKVQEVLHARYRPNPPTAELPEDPGHYPFIRELGEQVVVFELGDKRYAANYSINEAGEAVLEDPVEVKEQYARPDGSVVSLADATYHVFPFTLGDAPAEGEDDDLVWKEILHAGKWFKTDSGKQVEVTPDIVQEVYRAFGAGLPRYVSVPTDSHHIATRGIVPVEHNKGFVKKLKLHGDGLFAGFKFTNPTVDSGVRDGSIADCSVYLQPDVAHPETGERYGWVLRHVLLTNNPLVQDLRGWNDIPADDGAGGPVYVLYEQAPSTPSTQESAAMSEQTPNSDAIMSNPDEIILTGQARDEYVELRGLGLSLTELQELKEQRDEIRRQATALREQARSLRVTQIVRALEGLEEVDGVTQIEGYRHYPVVIQAVEQALTTGVKDLALDADESGAVNVDALILEVANAIPAEGRVAVEQPASDKRSKDLSDNKGERKVTDEQIDNLLEEISA